MISKASLRRFLPPILLEIYRFLKRALRLSDNLLTYAPQGWKTRIPEATGREVASGAGVALERIGWDPLIRRLQDSPVPLVTDDGGAPDILRVFYDHNAFMTFGYVLALAARHEKALRVLDYGGSLGYFHSVGSAMVPDIELDYHCKELPEVARVGKIVSPEVTWHTDDSCLDLSYDLVIFSGSLQYIEGWRDVLSRAAQATSKYLYLTRVSVVEHGAGYVAMQRYAGGTMLHEQFNKRELLETLERTGLQLVREFWVGNHPRIENAPCEPAYYGCLLRRNTPRA